MKVIVIFTQVIIRIMTFSAVKILEKIQLLKETMKSAISFALLRILNQKHTTTHYVLTVKKTKHIIIMHSAIWTVVMKAGMRRS